VILQAGTHTNDLLVLRIVGDVFTDVTFLYVTSYLPPQSRDVGVGAFDAASRLSADVAIRSLCTITVCDHLARVNIDRTNKLIYRD